MTTPTPTSTLQTTVHVHTTPVPITVSLPTSVKLVYGESTTIPCTAAGNPPPHITWSQFPVIVKY